MKYKDYKECTICHRNCRVNRNEGETGYCHMSNQLMAARAALHFWEEPCISGESGSGTIFFSGCSLSCVYCQNHDIAIGLTGKELNEDRLSDIFLELQGKGAHNINLVTPTHFVPQIIFALEKSKALGLTIPIIYNTGSYETVDTIKRLEGLIDIYLPDLKYYSDLLSMRYSNAPHYFEHATRTIDEMFQQVGSPVFDEDIMRRGMIVRHLALPNALEDSKKILKYLYETYHDDIYVSILNQFTPLAHVSVYPEINRTLSEEEYDELVNYAIELGYTNAFIQEGETARESFIPPFTCEGI